MPRHAGTEDKALAQEIALKARQDLIDQLRLGRTPQREMTVDEALARYWQEYATHLSSARAIWTQMLALADGLGGNIRLSAITETTVESYVARRRSAPQPMIRRKDGKRRWGFWQGRGDRIIHE